MRFRLLKLRLRRGLHNSQQQVEDLGNQTEVNIDKYLIKKLPRLEKVRGFVFVWLGIVVFLIFGLGVQNLILSSYYQKLQPVPGGIYNEGILGTFTSANPLYATNDVDTTVSHLIFSGLLKYNENNQLTGDLATNYQVDPKGVTYTVTLKPNLKWQDGKALTAQDVVYTYHLIQNPDAQSPLMSSWSNIQITATNPQTVVFKLPNPLASFPEDLTNGIVPEHILSNVSPSNLRISTFNTYSPIGSGPFQWQAINVRGNDPTNAYEQIALVPSKEYYASNAKLKEFVIHAYADQNQLIKDFKSGQLTSIEGLSSVPPSLAKMHNLVVNSLPFTAGVYVFFKNTSPIFSDAKLRSALIQGIDQKQLIEGLGYSTKSVVEPLLNGMLAFDQTYSQPAFDESASSTALTADGWVLNKDGYRYKDNKPLSFGLTISNTPEFIAVAKQLQSDWKILGVKMNINAEDINDISGSIQTHDYDAILYGISIGVDPDVFVYWGNTSGVHNNLNLSEYKSTGANQSLEQGRTRLTPALRVIKYKAFLQSWQQDLPAMGLYQPRLLYLTNGTVYGLNNHLINTNSDRFSNVSNWEIIESKVNEN